MKTIISILSCAAVLTIAIGASGFAFDGAVVLSIAAASALVGMFVSDYSRAPRGDHEAEAAPAPVSESAHHADSGAEFATFNTMNTLAG